MTRVVKGFLCGLVIIAFVLVPACRSKKTTPPKVVPAETAESVPPIPTMTTTTETRVTNPPDFVQTETQSPRVTTENLPADIEELNRVAQQRGYLQDAFFVRAARGGELRSLRSTTCSSKVIATSAERSSTTSPSAIAGPIRPRNTS